MLAIDESKTCSRQEVLLQWYEEAFPTVARFIQSRGGHLEDAKELFQEAVVLYYEKAVLGRFEPEKEEVAYIIGITKKLWLRRKDNERHFEELGKSEIADEKEFQPAKSKILKYLKQSGERCMELLQAFYYERLSMKDMAKKFGYTSERSATVQKYKCLEKVRNEIKQRSQRYEDFFE